MVQENDRIRGKVPELFSNLMEPHLEQVDEVISPGLTVLRWTSLNLEPYIQSVYAALGKAELLIDRAVSIHDNRIEVVFQDMLLVPLCDVPPSSTLTTTEFCSSTSALCKQAGVTLDIKSQIVEQAVRELTDLLLGPEVVIEQIADETAPGAIALQRKQTQRDKLHQEAENLLLTYEQQNIDTLVQLTRTTLEGIRKRLAVASVYGEKRESKSNPPLFQADILLVLPTITMSPSLDEVQQGLNQAVACITSVNKSVYRWGQVRQAEGSRQESTSPETRSQMIPTEGRARSRLGGRTQHTTTTLKDYYHVVSEHKEVAKIISLLSTAVNSTKNLTTLGLDQFDQYRAVWEVEKEQHMTEFMEEGPGVNEFRCEMQHYMHLEEVCARGWKIEQDRERERREGGK